MRVSIPALRHHPIPAALPVALRHHTTALARAAVASLLVSGAVSAAPVRAQSLLDRPPNLGGTWTGESGTLHFHFMHRFEATDPPARKVLNSPTFLIAGSLPYRTMIGARYATNSLVRTGYPNEWEFFARWHPIVQGAGAPIDAAVHGGWNQAARSVDGEVTVARRLGRLRAVAVGRAFSDAYHSGEARYAIGGGATLQLHDWLALAGDATTLLDLADDEEVAWSAGLQLRIPLSPHTLSLHASNANTTTLQGSARGVGEVMYGFEFTVPLTLSRYFGGGSPSADAGAVGAAASDAVAAVEVGMSNRLLFTPDTVRIRVGETVLWRNTSVLPHTVTADPTKVANAQNVILPAGAAAFDSGNMDPDATFSHTFTVAGTYRYVCVPHELANMIGVVIVE